jgi:hypothetical protein
VTARAVLAAALVPLALGCAKRLAHPAAPAQEVRAEVRDDAPEAFRALTGAYERVLRVSERLRLANVDACRDQVTEYLGWSAMSDRDFGGLEMRKLATDFVNAGKAPVVVALSPDGPAARAGVRIGDHVLEIGRSHVRSGAQVTHAEQSLASTGDSLVVERGGKELELPVSPARACRHEARLSDAPGLTASFQGSAVWVTFKLVDLADDDQLAFSIAHAMTEQLLGADPDHVGPEQIPEPEATALAVQFCEHAGFSVKTVDALLETQAIEEPWTLITTRHPREKVLWEPKAGIWVGEIPRRIVALRMVRASR